MTKRNEVLLKFGDAETVKYIRLVMRRKRTSITSYLLDNLEWDDPLPCMIDLNEGCEITPEVCGGCDQYSCPDREE